MDESAPQHVHAEFARVCHDQRWPVQLLHFQSSWVYCFGRCSRIRRPNSDGRTDKAQWKGLLVFTGRTHCEARGRKNGARWKPKRRYRENSGTRAIVAEEMGKITRQ